MAEAWGLLKELYSSSGAAGHYRRGGSPIFLKVFKEEMERGLKRSFEIVPVLIRTKSQPT